MQMLASARMSPLVLEPAHTTLKSSSNPAAIEELCFPPLQELRAPCQRGQKDRQRVPAAAPQHGQKTQRSAYTTCHHRCSRKTPRTKDAIVRSSKPSQQLGCSPGARLVQEPGAASPARRRQRPRRLPHTNLPNPVPMATKATGWQCWSRVLGPARAHRCPGPSRAVCVWMPPSAATLGTSDCRGWQVHRDGQHAGRRKLPGFYFQPLLPPPQTSPLQTKQPEVSVANLRQYGRAAPAPRIPRSPRSTASTRAPSRSLKSGRLLLPVPPQNPGPASPRETPAPGGREESLRGRAPR